MSVKVEKFVYRAPRILSILFILTGLFVISWKHELVGVVTFITVGLLYSGLTVFSTIQSDIPWYLAVSWSLTIAGPALLVGILFLVNWKRKRQL